MAGISLPASGTDLAAGGEIQPNLSASRRRSSDLLTERMGAGAEEPRK